MANWRANATPKTFAFPRKTGCRLRRAGPCRGHFKQDIGVTRLADPAPTGEVLAAQIIKGGLAAFVAAYPSAISIDGFCDGLAAKQIVRGRRSNLPRVSPFRWPRDVGRRQAIGRPR